MIATALLGAGNSTANELHDKPRSFGSASQSAGYPETAARTSAAVDGELIGTIALVEFGLLGISGASAAGLGVLIVPIASVLMGAEEIQDGKEDARWQWRPFLLTLGIGGAIAAYPYARFGLDYRGAKDDRFAQASLETFALVNVAFWSWYLVNGTDKNSGIILFPTPEGVAGILRTWRF